MSRVTKKNQEAAAMNPSPAPEPATSPADAPAPASPSPAHKRRAPRTPLTPARVGDSIGEGADPEQDVAPNLGGESQMQDA
jgi:hypothetical protein